MRFRAITNEIFKVKYLKNLLFLLCIGITVFVMVVFALNQYIAIEMWMILWRSLSVLH